MCICAARYILIELLLKKFIRDMAIQFNCANVEVRKLRFSYPSIRFLALTTALNQEILFIVPCPESPEARARHDNTEQRQRTGIISTRVLYL